MCKKKREGIVWLLNGGKRWDAVNNFPLEPLLHQPVQPYPSAWMPLSFRFGRLSVNGMTWVDYFPRRIILAPWKLCRRDQTVFLVFNHFYLFLVITAEIKMPHYLQIYMQSQQRRWWHPSLWQFRQTANRTMGSKWSLLKSRNWVVIGNQLQHRVCLLIQIAQLSPHQSQERPPCRWMDAVALATAVAHRLPTAAVKELAKRLMGKKCHHLIATRPSAITIVSGKRISTHPFCYWTMPGNWLDYTLVSECPFSVATIGLFIDTIGGYANGIAICVDLCAARLVKLVTFNTNFR